MSKQQITQSWVDLNGSRQLGEIESRFKAFSFYCVKFWQEPAQNLSCLQLVSAARTVDRTSLKIIASDILCTHHTHIFVGDGDTKLYNRLKLWLFLHLCCWHKLSSKKIRQQTVISTGRTPPNFFLVSGWDKDVETFLNDWHKLCKYTKLWNERCKEQT